MLDHATFLRVSVYPLIDGLLHWFCPFVCVQKGQRIIPYSPSFGSKNIWKRTGLWCRIEGKNDAKTCGSTTKTSLEWRRHCSVPLATSHSSLFVLNWTTAIWFHIVHVWIKPDIRCSLSPSCARLHIKVPFCIYNLAVGYYFTHRD